MGSGLARGAARAQSDLSVYADRPARQVGLLAILALDGVLSAILGAFFLPLYLGAMPFPISALISGLLNAALVWAGLQVTTSPRLAAIALWTWLATIAGLLFGGPGGDIVFGASDWGQIAVLLLMVLGVAPPAFVLWRRR